MVLPTGAKMESVKKIGNWFRNYWYYYKWRVIIVAFFVGVILFCIVQSGDREQYDVCILYTGPHLFEIGEKESLSSSFTQVMSEDYDGNGKKNVQIVDMPAFTDDQLREEIGTSDDPVLSVRYAPYTVDNVKSNFSQMVFSGDTVICLVDEYWYKILRDADGLVRLEEVLGYRPDTLRDDYSADFRTLDFSAFFGSASKLPEGTIICFRKMPTASAFTGRKAAEKNYENSKKMLADLFAFKNPQ